MLALPTNYTCGLGLLKETTGLEFQESREATVKQRTQNSSDNGLDLQVTSRTIHSPFLLFLTKRRSTGV